MKLRKITGLALSAIMVVSQVMPVMAENATEATPAAGNVLAYTNNEILAPTAIQVSFNPQGYDFTLRDGAEAVTDQIVSLNYGFASNATNDMLAKVTFTAAYTPGANPEKEIEFVSTKAEAQPKSESNANGAEKGELKVYLAVATSAAKVEASLAGDGAAFEVDDTGASTATAELLADVDMTAVEAAAVPFEDNKADIALKLAKATYTVKEDQEVNFTTTQEQLKDMMVIAADGLGGIGGFTFIGAMNPDADWTKAKVEAITITPTFDLTTEASDDDALITGTYAQVTVGPTYTTVTGAYESANTRYQISLPEGTTIATPADVTNLMINGSAVTGAVTTNNAGSVVRFTRDQVKGALGTEGWNATTADSELTVTFKIGTTNYKSIITRG